MDNYKEWTDHIHGIRYYITYFPDKVNVRIAKYPRGDTIFETTSDLLDFETFMNYIKKK